MISCICPVCKTENTLDLDFQVSDYVCKSCKNLIDKKENRSRGPIKQPNLNVVLSVGDKGVLDGKEFTVSAIVVKKYGSSTYWREYYLKDNLGNNAFLSESDGHWVLMYPKESPKGDYNYFAEFEGKKYRWYEATHNSVAAAEGFFEDKFELKLATYNEYVNGTEMVSWEETGKEKEFFWGKHIPRQTIKRAFKPPYMPYYKGVGIAQPFYYNIMQMLKILGVSALLISMLQLYIYLSRTNYPVFQQTIKFEDLKDKELVSKSFVLEGASSPLNIEINSEVDNSWANAQISLVNESNNEITFTSQDVEYYHGYSDGESWSEGSPTKEINFCGVAPGKYHLLISAEKEPGVLITPTTVDNSVAVTPDGYIEVRDAVTGNIVTYGDIATYKKDSAETAARNKLTNEQNSAIGLTDVPISTTPQYSEINPTNQSISLKAKWLPVSVWNYCIVLGIMAVFILFSYWLKYNFVRSKWKNSSNSPYSKT